MGGPDGRHRLFRKISYTPLPSQRAFHLLQKRFKGFSGPVGSGKSAALCQEAIRLSYQNPGRLGLIGAPTYPMLRATTQNALLEILTANRIPFEHRKAENLLIFRDSNSRIVFRSLGDCERLRGANLAWFGVDELTYTQEESWQRLEARLRDPLANRLCGFAVWTPKGHDWVYRRFILAPPEGYGAILAAPNENRYILEKIPDYYESLRRSYSEAFYRQEVLGEYLALDTGRVYSEFRREEHVKPLVRDAAKPLLWALDFNVDPMCSIVAQRFEEDLNVLDEIVISRAGTARACEQFLQRYPDHRGGLRIYGDASAHRMQTAGASDYQIIKSHLRASAYKNVVTLIPKSNPLVRDRVQLVNSRFRTAEGSRHLFIDPRCQKLIRDLEEVKYKGDSGEIDKTQDSTLTHLSDALGYLIWAEYAPRQTIGERTKRIF